MLSSRSKKINQKHSLALLSGYLFVFFFFFFFLSSLIHFIHLICCLGIKFNFDVLDSKYIYLNTYLNSYTYHFYFFFVEVGCLWTGSKSYTSVNACVFTLPRSSFSDLICKSSCHSSSFFCRRVFLRFFIWREKKNNNTTWNDCESLFALWHVKFIGRSLVESRRDQSDPR